MSGNVVNKSGATLISLYLQNNTEADLLANLDANTFGIATDTKRLVLDNAGTNYRLATIDSADDMAIPKRISLYGDATTYMEFDAADNWGLFCGDVQMIDAVATGAAAGVVTIGNGADYIDFDVYNKTLFVDASAGLVGIGTTPAEGKIEIECYVGSPTYAHSAGIELKSTVVDHGMTSVYPASVFGALDIALDGSASAGGLMITGLTENVTAQSALVLRGFMGAASPTSAAIQLVGGKKSSATFGDLAATEKTFEILNNATSLATMYGDGHFAKVGTFAAIDCHDASAAQNIATGTTYTKLTCFTENMQASILTADYANGKITVTKAGKYRISFNASFTSGTNNVTYSMAPFVDGVEIDEVHARVKVATGADVAAVAASGFVTVAANKDVDLRVKHGDVGTVALTIVYAALAVDYVGE